MNSIADVWDKILDRLKGELSETTINTWFDELEAIDIQGNTFFLHCSNEFKKNNIEMFFTKSIKDTLKDFFSMDFEVRILDDNGLAALKGTSSRKQNDRFTSDEFTFDTFVVGPSNKLAYAASVAVAQHPAQNYNPLLIYGDSGLGKTHLIYSIANVIKKNHENARIAYVKGDDFTNELVAAIQAGPNKTAEMREKYRQADLLLVDDIQFIAGKKQTQEEFFHTFNNLYESGRQIVLTSDRPPSEMTMLEDRLRTRFEWGLLVDVAPPDFETRLAIVKNKSAILGLDLPDKVAVFIAENVTANVRQLEGTINKIMAFKDLLGNDADEETVTRAIQDMLKRSNEYVPTPEAILEYISKYYTLEESVIRGQQRIRDAVQARQIAMYLIRSMTNLSLEDIGRQFDNRDHSTVLYSIKEVEKKMKKDAAFAETVKAIKTNINSRR
ncbi:MAG: chromosomal replication initiator protein DnaA [Oscillibacter sp.]|nr:chromosomal replication initiator protein DnaA [Oscillibacter sp.]